MNKQFEKLVTIKQFDMCCATNKRINSFLLNYKVYIYSIKQLCFQTIQQIPTHLDILLSCPFIRFIILKSLLTKLHPRWIKWHIPIRITTDQYYMIKPLQTRFLTQLVNKSVFNDWVVIHSHLTQWFLFVPFAEQPHTRVEQFGWLVHVAEVGRTECAEGVEFVFVLF